MSTERNGTLLHGVPLDQWIGRMMKCDGGKKASGTKSRNPVKIISFCPKGLTATVHPSGHRGTDVVTLDKLLPWWSRNDDLRKPPAMNLPPFHHLNPEKFVGRYVKAYLGDLGTCRSILKGFQRGQFVVMIKRGKMETEYKVEPIHINPNWSENQDLFQEMMVAKAQKDNPGQTNLGVVFEAAKKPEPEQVTPERAQPQPPVPVASEVPAKPIYVPRPVHIPKPTPKPVSSPSKPEFTPPAFGKVKHLIVSINSKPGWDKDLEALQGAMAEQAHLEGLVERAKLAQMEHSKYIQLCVDALTEKGVGVEWESGDIPMTVKTSPGTPATKRTCPTLPINEGRLRPHELRTKLYECMVPKRMYLKEELAKLTGEAYDKRFSNTLSAVFPISPEIKSESAGVGNLKHYYLE